MKLAFALLLIGTTLGTGPAAFAVVQGAPMTPRAVLHPATDTDTGAALILIDADEAEDDDDEGGWLWPKSHDDDDDDEGDDDCQKHDDACVAGTSGNAAKAGTVAPPKNGLFTNGTAPVVQSN